MPSRANAPAKTVTQAKSQARPSKTNIPISRPNNVTNSIKKPVLSMKAKTDEAVAVASLVSAYQMLEEVKTADSSDNVDGSPVGAMDQAAFFSVLQDVAKVLTADNAESITNALAEKLNIDQGTVSASYASA